MQKSESIANLTSALVEAQKLYKPLIKRTVNPFYNKKYADLAEVIECTQPALNANGLTIIQLPFFEDNKAGIETILLHSSGEYVGERSLVPGEQKNPQTFGIGLTYLRRYAWQSIAGVAADDATEDDGNSLSGKEPNKVPPKVNQKPAKAKEEARPGEQKAAAVDETITEDTLPSKEELKEIQVQIRQWAERPEITKDQLITFIRKEAHQEDSKLITKGQWSSIFAKLAAAKPETLAALIGEVNE